MFSPPERYRISDCKSETAIAMYKGLRGARCVPFIRISHKCTSGKSFEESGSVFIQICCGKKFFPDLIIWGFSCPNYGPLRIL